MTENKICPFMYSGFMEPCIENQCMAWVKECPWKQRNCDFECPDECNAHCALIKKDNTQIQFEEQPQWFDDSDNCPGLSS